MHCTDIWTLVQAVVQLADEYSIHVGELVTMTLSSGTVMLWEYVPAEAAYCYAPGVLA